MKIDTNNLYVACRVFDSENEVESWVQYESQGLINHNVYVYPKRILVFKQKSNDGDDVYINVDNFDIMKVTNYTSSFDSHSDHTFGLYRLPNGTNVNCGIGRVRGKASEIQFLMPFSDFIKERFGFDIGEVTLLQAKALIKLNNMFEDKPFRLSNIQDEAEDQINDIIYQKGRSKTKRR